MKFITQLMYYQGLCVEDPEPEPELDFYLQFYQLWLARLLVKYRPLRLFLKFLRKGVCCVAMATSSIVVVLSVMSMVKNKDDHIIVMENTFCVFMCVPTIVLLALYYFQSEKINFITGQFEHISRQVECDNDEKYVEMLKANTKFCDKVARYSIFLAIPIYVVLVTVVHIVNLLPNRKQWESLWYPYDETKSPAYEITIFLRWIQIVSNGVTSATAIVVSLAILSQMSVHFKILVDKLENIRDYSIRKILMDKLSANDESDVVNVVNTTVKNENSFRGGISLDDIDNDHVTLDIQTDEGLSVQRKLNLSYLRLESEFPEVEFEQLVEEIEILTSSQKVTEDSLECVDDFEPSNSKAGNFELLTVENLNPSITLTTKEDVVTQGYTSEELGCMMRRNLIQSVKTHQILLKVAKTFESALNMINIVLFINIVTVYGATIVLFSQDNIYLSHAVYIVTLLNVVLTYFTLSYMMNIITNQSEAVGEAAYACDWTEASPAFKRNILILMTRANVPLEFKPTGLEPLSVQNFGVVTKIAYKMAMSMRDIISANTK